MKSRSVTLIVLLLFSLPALVPAYTSGQAEDAFFWHYWHKVFLEPDPTPPGDSVSQGLPDFGLFFVNTSKFQTFWAVAGVNHVVWGADWFKDKIKDGDIMSARMVLAGVWKNAFGIPLSFQVGGYGKWMNGHYFPAKDLEKNPALMDYTGQPRMRIVMGGFYQTNFDAKRIVGDLQWIPGVGSLAQPGTGAVNLGARALNMILGPSALWRTTDTASGFQLGLSTKRNDIGFIYSLKILNSYRQAGKKLDYAKWSSALGDSELWSLVLEGQTPCVRTKAGKMGLLYGYWTSKQDGAGWRLGLTSYFSRTLHMDLSLAYNEWTQDPVVGKTDNYKLVLSYYN